MNAKKIAELGLLAALAVIFGWVEHLLPLVPSVPGIKLGLGNTAVMVALYRLGRREAALVSTAKVTLCALLFGSFSGLIYSASGAAVSLAVMCVMYRKDRFSPVGVSAAGGAAHITAQVAAAAVVTAVPQLWRILAPLLAAGTLTGALNGFLMTLLLRRIETVKQYPFAGR